MMIVVIGTSLIAEAESIYMLDLSERQMRVDGKDISFVLGSVESASLPQVKEGEQIQMPATIKYHLDVIATVGSAVDPGNNIVVAGTIGMQGSHASKINMPRYQEEAIVLFAVKQEADKQIDGDFEFAGAGWLPIGIKSPAMLDQNEIDDVVKSIDAVKRLMSLPPEERLEDEVIDDLLASPNPYVRSLGAYVLAVRSRDADVDQIKSWFSDKKRSAGEIYWADTLLVDVVDSELRPASEARVNLMRTWIEIQAEEERR
jgi:hypothetical protein